MQAQNMNLPVLHGEVQEYQKDEVEDAEKFYSARFSRNFLVAFGFLQSVSCSGIIIGYTAISDALKSIGEYSDLCSSGVTGCSSQALRFSLFYIIGSSCLFGSFIINGSILDNFGPKFSTCLGLLVSGTGFVLLAVSQSNGFDAFAPAFGMIGAGGPGVHLSLFHISTLYEPRVRGTIKSYFLGAFVASAFLFSLEGWLIQTEHVSKEAIFLVHGCWLYLLCILGLVIWPWKIFKVGNEVRMYKRRIVDYVILDKSQQPASSSRSLVAPSAASDMASTPEFSTMNVLNQNGQPITILVKLDRTEQPAETGSTHSQLPAESMKLESQSSTALVPGKAEEEEEREVPMSELPLKQQLMTWTYRKLLLFCCIQVMRFNYYIGTFIQQIEYKPTNRDGHLTTTYSLILTLVVPSGIITIPLVGRIFDTWDYYWIFVLCNFLGMVYGALLLVPVLEVQIVTIVFLCLHRMILFSILLSYTSYTFGFKNFGFILGLLQLIASALSVIVYPIISAVESHLDGNFFWVNLAFLAAMMPLWVICPAKFPKK
ncbi:hypothetical protein GUITHDRAFT_164760 [Guillardia theta CCMP2712]|uniref:Major facilitator superfamily (MFS) profile domain-containing protein n=2 Tax=Guillardia theta TaxID=55529 RepID=L1IVW0_GUITC|nr:hypothetical protein GUITHDRAFT_164760 [Guillardia theta CCMP2712]EKX40029.1 hypothetical protein GUITHDRAFT_164760 [Guillardia theta CCMP2712]|eukprot:XP_005827009.1 hypothetical protein GUITHDRAFT_164760 [Guillardia theta CCMP2712]